MVMSGQGEMLRMAQLRSSLLTEARDLITEMTCTDEALEALDKRYVDKKVTVVTTMCKLLLMRLPQGQSCNNVEALAAG